MSNETVSLSEFVSRNAQKDDAGRKFQLENIRTLEVNMNGQMWIKLGSMVAYRGILKFEREGMLDHGLGQFVRRAVSGEVSPLTKVTGSGVLYLADDAKHVTLVNLENESFFVNGANLLAFEPSIQFEIKMIRKVAAMLAGGLFAVRLTGTGVVALTSHGEPVTLQCSPGDPISTDPNSTIAWSGTMFPTLKTDISMKTLLGRGSGESIQMQFTESGFVIVQPFEENKAVQVQS